MNAEQQIIELVRKGEGLDLEFKACRSHLNRDVYETVCAFLNRHGGTLLLGVQDNGVIQGIEPEVVAQIRQDFVTAVNNPQKIIPPTYLAVDEVTVAGKPLLRIYVPESSQVHRCNGRIYDRNEDGDIDITDHTVQVARLYQRKQASYSFVKKHLPDPFYLEGIERRSLRDAIFREVASNILIHREYTSGATTRLIIEYGRVVTDNPSRPHGFGRLDPATTVPFQKNPVIGAFFRQIDRADELGSGMRKMMLYGKKYGGADPELIEGDIFRMVISVPEFGANPAAKMEIVQSGAEPKQVGEQVSEQVGEQVAKVLIACKAQPRTRAELLDALGLANVYMNYKRHLLPLIEHGFIEMTIPDKPRSSQQKYRITAAGGQVLENIE